MNPVLKNVLFGAAILLFIIAAVNAYLYRVAVVKAELVNAALKAKAANLETEKADIMALGEAFARAKAKEIQLIHAAADAQMAKAQSIKTRSAGQVFTLRNEKISLEAKYNLLESDSLAKGEKIVLLEQSNAGLLSEIIGLKKIDASRLITISKLNALIDDPEKGYKKLLADSIANTNSVLKRNRSFWRRLSVVAGWGLADDGKGHWQLTAGIRVI